MIFYKYRYFKFKEIENQVKINLDSLYFYYYDLLSKIKKSGVCCERKISANTDPYLNTNTDTENVEEAYSIIDLSKPISDPDRIKLETKNPLSSKIKKGIYIMDVSNLIHDKEYVLSLTPLISLVSSERFDGTAGTKYENSKFVSITNRSDNKGYKDTITSNDGNLRTPLPAPNIGDTNIQLDEDLSNYYSPPYFTNKNSTSINISILENKKEYSCANLLSEYCEIGSIQGSLFYYDNGSGPYYYNLTNVSGRLNLNHVYGGKGFSSNPFFIRFKTKNSDKIKIKIKLGIVEDVSNKYDKDETCLNEIILRVEPASQVKEIKNISTEDINNPEIEYGDGGERYYEPWKFWIEGDLKSDAQGNPSWYKKWKSWFKEKIRIHNKWVDNPNRTDIEDDIDAFKEDPNYKQDHL